MPLMIQLRKKTKSRIVTFLGKGRRSAHDLNKVSFVYEWSEY